MEWVGGIVLFGGGSRRMGRPKAALPFGDETLLGRVVRVVSTVVRPVAVAGRRDQAVPHLPSDVMVVHDAVENAGPLAGVAAGFGALAGRCDAAFVSSCDHPLLEASLIRRLIDRLGEAPAVVPRHEGHLHPLLAVYRLETADLLNEMLAGGELRAHEFARRCRAREIASDELRECDPDLCSLMNLNDPAAYERALRLLGH
jgi:molybdopterin-guanine dinucleotide biosynthesis protein A